MSEPTFTAKQVCAALSVSHGTLNAWAHAGWFVHLDAAQTIPGKARRFTVSDVFTLAIFKTLLNLGVSGKESAFWAQLSMSEREEIQMTALLIADFDKKVIALNPAEGAISSDFLGVKMFSIDLGGEGRPPKKMPIGIEMRIYPRAIAAAAKARLSLPQDPEAWWNKFAPDLPCPG
jgi:hypothetical protein